MGDVARPILQITGAVVGGMIGGPIGASIGATIGQQAGAALFPQNVGQGPRINDLKVMNSAYGQAIPICYGAGNRFSGNIIWTSGIRESSTDREVSKGNEVTEFTYYVDLAIAICEGPISNVTRVWANGKTLWSGSFIGQNVTDLTEDYNTADANATALEAEAAACGSETDPDCADLYARAAAARDQADAFLAAKTAAESTQTSYNTGSTAWSFTVAGSSFVFHPGTMDQAVDPTIQADKGANTTAYPGICYVVIKNFNLTEYGNALPNLEFEVTAQARTVRAALADISERAGLASYDYSASLRIDDTLDGYTIATQMTPLAAVAQLESAFHFDTIEQWGQIRYVPRAGHIKATIDPGDFSARIDRSGARLPILTSRINDEALPNLASLTYKDAARDYQPNTQIARRGRGNSQNNLNLEYGITLSDSKARSVVDRLLFEPWVSRLSFQGAAHPKWDFASPGDVIGVPVAGAVMPFRIIRIVRGANGIIDIEALRDDPFIYEGNTAVETNTATNTTNSNSAAIRLTDTQIYCFNAPILDPAESDTGFSWSVNADGTWSGGALYRSPNGVSYSNAQGVRTRNITGVVAEATGSGPTSTWDTGTEIEVVLDYDTHTLSSKTDSEVINGANAFWLGAADGSTGEVVQFATATLISASPRTYRLTRLLRGRRATEYAVGEHGTDEVFVLLEPGYYRSLDYGGSDYNLTYYYKGVTSGQSVDDVIPSQAFTNTLEKAKPRSPVQIQGARDVSNNLTVTFQRRIRGFYSGFGALPLDEPTEEYEIDILSGVTVVRTIIATSETFSYTAAQQTADGLTPGNPVSGNIYQISSRVGRGHPGAFTV